MRYYGVVMKHMPLLLLALIATAAQAGYACRDPGDPEGRRWFQDGRCELPMVHDPLPDPPLIREAPKIPAEWGWSSAGSERQFLGFDEKGRPLSVWVERGTARPFVSTDVVRLNGGRGGRGRRR